MYDLICGHCGKTFTAPNRAKRYCSEECRRIVNRANARRNAKLNHKKPAKHCVICGKELVKYQIKYCSKACQRAAERKQKTKVSASINDIQAAAAAEGLSYGMYCALHCIK